eukprot:c21947_g1_i4.p1 GENE.c21947_g1_i4~~c21947_g1_i4.p1  ORF type:complete len:212 (+),score=78.61 c21947_g1_i4:888-1523(+)
MSDLREIEGNVSRSSYASYDPLPPPARFPESQSRSLGSDYSKYSSEPYRKDSYESSSRYPPASDDLYLSKGSSSRSSRDAYGSSSRSEIPQHISSYGSSSSQKYSGERDFGGERRYSSSSDIIGSRSESGPISSYGSYQSDRGGYQSDRGVYQSDRGGSDRGGSDRGGRGGSTRAGPYRESSRGEESSYDHDRNKTVSRYAPYQRPERGRY